MTNTATTCSLVIEREMAHTPEKIWRALTQGPLIAEWLMTNDFQPIVGHRFQFRNTPVPGWTASSIVKCCWSNRTLASPMAGHHGAGNRCHLDVDADRERHAPAHGAIRLPLRRRANYKGAKYGWTNFIGKLEHVVGGIE